jgi:predicted ester cyclase
MPEETNKHVIRRWLETMDRRAWDEAAACWAPDAINHASGRFGAHAPRGRESIKRVFEMLHIAFPDRRWQIEDMIAEGDRVACRMTVSGTFGAVPPLPDQRPPGSLGVEGTRLASPSASGKSYSVSHIHIFRIANGLIAEHWAARDDIGLLQQLGAVTPPPVA